MPRHDEIRRFRDTVEPGQHESLCSAFKQRWQSMSLPALGRREWDEVLETLRSIALGYYEMVARARMFACIRAFWHGPAAPGREQERSGRLRAHMLQYGGFVTLQKLARERPYLVWARGQGDFPTGDDAAWFDDFRLLSGIGQEYTHPLREADVYVAYAAWIDGADDANRGLATFVGWTYLRHFLDLTVWRSEENVAAHAALAVGEDRIPDHILRDFGVARGGLPFAIQAGHLALDEALYSWRYGQAEEELPRLQALRRKVYYGHRAVERQLRAVRTYVPNCEGCLNADMEDLVTQEKIPQHRCWRSPNGRCWDMAALRRWYNTDHANRLPDHSGPLPAALFEDTENAMV